MLLIKKGVITVKYQITITELDEKMQGKDVRAIRTVGDLESWTSAVLVEDIRKSLPCLFIVGIDKEIADHIIETFNTYNIKTIIEESTIDRPMIFFPQAGKKFKWSNIFGAVPVKE